MVRAVDITESNAMLVGQEAVESYATETGYADRGDTFDLSPVGLRNAADYLGSLMGDHLEAAIAADRRGQDSPTPPPQRQRIIELIDYALRAAKTLERNASGDTLEADLIGELSAAVGLLRRWQNHPAWAHLAATVGHPTEQQHTLMALLLASYFVDGGNGVGLVETTGKSGRIADLWLRPGLLTRVDVELKTPQALRGPTGQELKLEEAKAIVARQLKKAASSLSWPARYS